MQKELDMANWTIGWSETVTHCPVSTWARKHGHSQLLFSAGQKNYLKGHGGGTLLLPKSVQGYLPFYVLHLFPPFQNGSLKCWISG